eukprot:Plantae.Rhodophyta-Hildenbrandia_rubra.ctg14713.p1 GENE.Plantae.Rhodophyta-Hildenbrandia_rubra.ctg14713~~Plantae.Rhodophyta-Hildenbrandia_rubra.ctg14713.p1  ORF type:complete len:227 (-),score=36.22 Plantae.Rhodophyta-Hildenbrandia_rubra.ctg14713:991-1671(-)
MLETTQAFLGNFSVVKPVNPSSFTTSNTCLLSNARLSGERHYPVPRRCVPSAMWVERCAKIAVESRKPFVYAMYSDLDSMPKFSPWLKSVQVLDKGNDEFGNGAISRWTLASKGLSFSWRARITSVRPNEIIAWESISGLKNRGSVTFVEVGGDDEVTEVCLKIAFNVAKPLAGLMGMGFISGFVTNTLLDDLKRFRTMVLEEKRRKGDLNVISKPIGVSGERGGV